MTDVEWAQQSCVAAVEMASLEWLLTKYRLTRGQTLGFTFFVLFLRQDLMSTQTGSKFSMNSG